MENIQTMEKCSICLDDQATAQAIVEKCLPVPFFGAHSYEKVKVATVGLNPAFGEFCENGSWKPREARLATLDDYQKSHRQALTDEDIEDATKRRDGYFRNLERGWHSYFESLDCLLGRVNEKWSFGFGNAIHLDLVACSTTERFGMLGDGCQAALQSNCRRHFERTLTQLPSEVLLFFNGVDIHRAIQPHFQNFQGRNELININGHMGCIGQFEACGRKFEFRSWSISVRRLTPVWRLDLAYWLRGSLKFPRLLP